jgi:hypothetical protein
MPKVIDNVWLGYGSYCREVESWILSYIRGHARGHVSTQDTIPRTASPLSKREAVGGSEKKEGEDDGKRGRIVRPHMCPPNKLEVWCPSGGAGAHGAIT